MALESNDGFNANIQSAQHPKQMSQQLLASQKDKKHHYNILNYPH